MSRLHLNWLDYLGIAFGAVVLSLSILTIRDPSQAGKATIGAVASLTLFLGIRLVKMQLELSSLTGKMEELSQRLPALVGDRIEDSAQFFKYLRGPVSTAEHLDVTYFQMSTPAPQKRSFEDDY